MNDDLLQLHAEMMDKYFDEGWSEGQVGKHYKRTTAMVKKLIGKEKLKGRLRTKETTTRTDPRRRENRRALSARHSMIGVRVTRHRARLEENMIDFGLKVGLSCIRIAELETGSYDPTLSELVALAKELDMPLEDLIREKPRVELAPAA